MRAFAERGRAPPRRTAPAAFRIGARNDPAEREADAVASRILGRPALQRRASGADLAGNAQAEVASVLASPGKPLGPVERGLFGPRLGVDLAAVRVHDGPQADRAARAVGARAFTLGTDLVFARGAYRTDEPEGRRLLAHELAHTGQDDAADTLRRQDGGGKKERKKEEPLVDGLKTAAEKLADKKEVKEKIIKPVVDKARTEFGALSTGERVGVVSFGAASYGLGLGALLGTEEGRKLLSETSVIAPLKLIPYWPITSFTYTLPERQTDPLKFSLGFDGTELLKIGRGDDPAWFSSLSLEANWSVQPETDAWQLTQLTGKLGLVTGVTLSGGLKKGPFQAPSDLVTGPEGEQLRSVTSIPSIPGARDPLKDQPNIGGFITIDLTKLPIIPEKVRRVLGGDVGGAR